MAGIRAGHHDAADGIALARAVLEVLDCPALLVGDSGAILAANATSRRLFPDLDQPTPPPTVSEWIYRLEDGDALSAALRAPGDGHDPGTVCVAHDQHNTKKRFAVRVRRPPGAPADSQASIILMTELRDQAPASAPGLQPPDPVHRLLVRQTLIEERERRRLGRALHDQVTQLLVQVRRNLADTRDGRSTQQPSETISDVDRVIRLLQELTSNFSPPVLEDLGLLPAMRWLAEHMRESYGAAARCDDDGAEPRLSPEVRTIAFRALRELSINAVKHAPGSNIRLSSSIDGGRCRLRVRDDGPGFECGALRVSPESYAGYGLLSIEQQIRAVGGEFEIRSALGEGTTATITLRLSPERGGGENDDA